MTKIQNKTHKSKDAWINYLESLPWTYFITGTTRYPLSISSNRRLLERFYKAICIRDSKLFYVAEPFDLRDGHHSHFLFHIPDNIKPFNPEGNFLFHEIINTWQWATGNPELKKGDLWSRIQVKRYDPKRGAAGYCGKYLFKSHSDYDMLTDYKTERNDCYIPISSVNESKPYRVRIPLTWLCRSATRS